MFAATVCAAHAAAAAARLLGREELVEVLGDDVGPVGGVRVSGVDACVRVSWGGGGCQRPPTHCLRTPRGACWWAGGLARRFEAARAAAVRIARVAHAARWLSSSRLNLSPAELCSYRFS